LEIPCSQPGTDPIHLLVDSTGVTLCGASEWLTEKHGTRTRRSWRKLHLGVDADTDQISIAESIERLQRFAAEVMPLVDP
jgi:Transposase DDE domain